MVCGATKTISDGLIIADCECQGRGWKMLRTNPFERENLRINPIWVVDDADTIYRVPTKTLICRDDIHVVRTCGDALQKLWEQISFNFGFYKQTLSSQIGVIKDHFTCSHLHSRSTIVMFLRYVACYHLFIRHSTLISVFSQLPLCLCGSILFVFIPV